MMIKKSILTFILLFCAMTQLLGAESCFSTAGFFAVEGAERKVSSLNPAWRMFKGSISENDKPYVVDYNDSNWQVVNLPNGIQLEPFEASGGVNYQGEAWYRKVLDMPQDLAGKRNLLYFEAIMGKSKIYINGELVREQFGGFTPIVFDATDYLKVGERNIIAVWADNSDDPIYPPGKPQAVLDFCYFGGIYRDVWLVSTSKQMYVTDENMTDKVAGGGLMFATLSANDAKAEVEVKLDIDGLQPKGKAILEFTAPSGEVVLTKKLSVKRGEIKTRLQFNEPELWSPENPNLYSLNVKLVDSKGVVVDEFIRKVGIRHIRFSYFEGFVLNGKQYPRKLMGANRHQDFAIVGNALSNSLHWRDAEKLKSCGLEIIRNAHYPQDPAFMDACDALGLFVISNTPGWQFWNDEPIFEQRVYRDVAQIIRRDRSRPSVIMWEPILNETWYPDDFAKNVADIVKNEMPYDGSNYTASDEEARGAEHFDILFCHPMIGGTLNGVSSEGHGKDTTKVYYTREWGDNVDDWNSHNSTSRVARNWGEVPQLVQAIHYASPEYVYTCYETLQDQPNFHFGGTLWHSFDHQRGYHPDPFYGGIMDAFRREKYSAKMFKAQTDLVEPNVFIANELTPFSSHDIIVFSNCEQVRLTTFFGEEKVYTASKVKGERWFTFPDTWNHQEDKLLTRAKQQPDVFIKAEGLDKDGNVVAVATRKPARRAAQISLSVDTMSREVIANGGDLVVVTASMMDNFGSVKRLNNSYVHFTVEGEGVIVSDSRSLTNPVQFEWGEASILVRTTTNSGTVKVIATSEFMGDHSAVSDTLEFTTVASPTRLLFDKDIERLTCNLPLDAVTNQKGDSRTAEELKQIDAALREIEQQQDDFGEKTR